MIHWDEIKKKLKSFLLSGKCFLNLKGEELENFKELNKRAITNFKTSQDVLGKIQWNLLTASEDALLRLTYVLFLTEGLLAFYINTIVYCLIRNEHHDIWFEMKQKFVSSFEELSEVPLSIKLKFLDIHGFDFFSDICRTDLRNAVAHQDFSIESDGTIYIKKGKKKILKQDSEEIIHDLTELINVLTDTFK